MAMVKFFDPKLSYPAYIASYDAVEVCILVCNDLSSKGYYLPSFIFPLVQRISMN